MITRTIAAKISKSVSQVPVVTVLGPRQAGKTTLVKALYPNYTYVNLEDRATRELAENDYIGFFEKYKGVEVDLILKKEGMLYPFEIKSSMTPNNDFSKNLRLFCQKEPNSKEMCVIYCGEEYSSFQNCRYINYKNIADAIKA